MAAIIKAPTSLLLPTCGVRIYRWESGLHGGPCDGWVGLTAVGDRGHQNNLRPERPSRDVGVRDGVFSGDEGPAVVAKVPGVGNV